MFDATSTLFIRNKNGLNAKKILSEINYIGGPPPGLIASAGASLRNINNNIV